MNYSKVISKNDGTNSKLWMYALARRIAAVQTEALAGGGELSPARLLNRLHALGIDCQQPDVDQALALKDINGKDSGLSVKDAAALIGVEAAVLEGWLGNPQEDMPTLARVYESAAGKVVAYDYYDALLFKRWKKAQEKESQ